MGTLMVTDGASPRFWWVNQNQTFDQEVAGGYLWSPKRRKDGARHRFYENMREVAPGDVVFSFYDTRISAIGVAVSYAYECPKPPEFGGAGPNWSKIGWKVDVPFVRLQRQIRPKDHIHLIRPHLPSRYAPLQENGNGLQQVYLAEISRPFAEALAGLIGGDVAAIVFNAAVPMKAERVEQFDRRGVDEWEDHVEETIKSNQTIPETQREALVIARRGQGIFKRRVMEVERLCRITGVQNATHLVGSHIKPWRDSSDEERLDGENGLLLTPSIDHLFDRGFITFEGSGDLLVSPRADLPSLARMGVPLSEGVNVGGFSARQRAFLEFHRDEVFLKVS